MNEDNYHLAELSSIIKLFEDAITHTEHVVVTNKPNLINHLSAAKEIYESLSVKDFDTIFLGLIRIGCNFKILNGLINIVNRYEDLVMHKKLLLIDGILINYFENIQKLSTINKKIEIFERELIAYENLELGMPKWEKQKIVDEDSKELAILKEERESIAENYKWLKTNFFEEILFTCDTIREKAQNHFDISIIKSQKIFFTEQLTNAIYKQLNEDKFLISKKFLNSKDFHKILNCREPDVDCCKTLKTTKFTSILNLLQSEIKKKEFNDIEWREFVIAKFCFNEQTLAKHSLENSELRTYRKILTNLSGNTH